MNSLSAQRNFLIGAILTGLIIAGFAIYPQIELLMGCENKCNNIYAISDFDEPFYAAYLQSLIDGKPRRNSPFSGTVDSSETPQKESYLSIQFLATYPLVFLAQTFNLSISQLMILCSLIVSFLSGLIIYWLFYLFTKDDISSLVATLFILFLGNLVGGQGATSTLFSSDGVHYFNSLIFLRRYVPAISFPALFLFIIFVWKLFTTDSNSTKHKSAILAFCSFTFCVYTYFYIWTTAFAWFFSFVFLYSIFNYEKLKENSKLLLGLGLSFVGILIPYFILVFNRQQHIDSALFINFTREPDFWRLPETISYISTASIFIFAKFRMVELKDPKIIFLLSLNLVTVVVFNQQIITGRSLQPFHYQFFSVNYLVTFSVFFLIYTLLKQLLTVDRLRLVITLLVSLPICVGIFDTVVGSTSFTSLNLTRDNLIPLSDRIKEIVKTPEFKTQNQNSVVLTFDFAKPSYFYGSEIPALSSQPILWSLHLNLMTDISPQEDKNRLKQFLYYQNVDGNQLRNNLNQKNTLISLGFFGGERISDIYTGKVNQITSEEIDKVIDDYQSFTQNFSYQNAQKPLLSFVLANRKVENDFTNLDRWYQRNEGEEFGEFILYQVKLRQP